MGVLNYWNKIKTQYGGWTTVIFFIFLLYLGSYTVDYQTNRHPVNETQGNQTITQQKLYYGENDLVPVRHLGKNDQNHFSVVNWLFLLGGSALYVIVVNSKKDKNKYTITQAKKKTKQYLLNDKDLKSNEFFIHKKAFQPSIYFDDKPAKPKSIWIFTHEKIENLHPTMDGDHNFGYEYDPYSLDLKRIVPDPDVGKGMKPVCPKCGKFPDERDRSVEKLRKLNEIVSFRNND